MRPLANLGSLCTPFAPSAAPFSPPFSSWGGGIACVATLISSRLAVVFEWVGVEPSRNQRRGTRTVSEARDKPGARCALRTSCRSVGAGRCCWSGGCLRQRVLSFPDRALPWSPATSTVDGTANMFGAFRPTQPSLIGLLWCVSRTSAHFWPLTAFMCAGKPHGSCHVHAKLTSGLVSSGWILSLRRFGRAGSSVLLWCVHTALFLLLCLTHLRYHRPRHWSCLRSTRCPHATSTPSFHGTKRVTGRASTRFPSGLEYVFSLCRRALFTTNELHS